VNIEDRWQQKKPDGFLTGCLTSPEVLRSAQFPACAGNCGHGQNARATGVLRFGGMGILPMWFARSQSGSGVPPLVPTKSRDGSSIACGSVHPKGSQPDPPLHFVPGPAPPAQAISALPRFVAPTELSIASLRRFRGREATGPKRETEINH